jgi:uridine phosphorylase
MAFGLAENVILKQAVPAHGIVCSNPARAARVAERLLSEPRWLCDAWGFSVTTGHSAEGRACFVAAVPMGAGGSGFAFHELFAAGARFIIRYGSSDRQVSLDQLREVLLIDQADNLYGLMREAGEPEAACGGLLPASSHLVAAVAEEAAARGVPLQRRICHHLEDYHAANFPDCSEGAHTRRPWLAATDDSSWCSDMESAALFFRARQFGAHAVSVPQPLLKQRGGTTPYSGVHAAISLEMEGVISALVGAALFRCRV